MKLPLAPGVIVPCTSTKAPSRTIVAPPPSKVAPLASTGTPLTVKLAADTKLATGPSRRLRASVERSRAPSAVTRSAPSTPSCIAPRTRTRAPTRIASAGSIRAFETSTFRPETVA